MIGASSQQIEEEVHAFTPLSDEVILWPSTRVLAEWQVGGESFTQSLMLANYCPRSYFQPQCFSTQSRTTDRD